MSVRVEPSAAFELSRPAPGRVRLAFAALFALSLASLPGAVVITLAVCSPGGSGFAWLHELAAGSPFGLAPWVGTAVALLALTLVLDKLYQARARRRYGRCRIEDDELLFEPCLGGGEERVPLDDVTGFAVGPHGVLVETLDRPALQRWSRPLLIPTANPAEQARVLAHLEAPREHAPGEASFGRARPPWVRAALGAALLLLSAPALVLVATRFGQLALTFVAVPVVFLQVPGLLLFERRALGPRWTPVHLGRRALFWEDRRVAWQDVTRVAWSESELIVEAGQERLRTRVTPRLEQAKRLLARRLAGAGSRLDPEGPVPGWAAPEARRRQVRRLLALVLFVPLVASALALSNPPVHDTITVSDDDEVEMSLRHRVSDDQPVELTVTHPGGRLVFHVGGASPSLTRAARQAAQGPPIGSVAGLVERWVGRLDDPRLHAWVEGRIGRRTFDEADPKGWTLAWGAEQGQVLFVVLVRPGASVDVFLRDCAYESPLGARYPDRVTLVDETLPLVRVDGPGAALALPGPLPSLDELLRVTRAVRSGATIAGSSRELRELMEAR